MGSVPKIAVAQAAAPGPPSGPPSGLRVVAPADPHPDGLLRAALEAHNRGLPLISLSTFWDDHIGGRLQPSFDSTQANRILLVSREIRGEASLSPADESIVRRVFSGEQQKALAFELTLAISTLSTRHNRALRLLRIAGGEVPVSLVLAAQCAAGLQPRIAARSASFEHQGDRCRVISVPRPATGPLSGLSPVERQVAALLMEGRSRGEIAAERRTSKHTVSRHVHSIFHALQVSGRYALIRRAAELGCFWSSE